MRYKRVRARVEARGRRGAEDGGFDGRPVLADGAGLDVFVQIEVGQERVHG